MSAAAVVAFDADDGEDGDGDDDSTIHCKPEMIVT